MEKLLNDPNILNIYMFGSQVYGTARPDSDTDFVIITKTPVISENPDHQYFTKEQFQDFINNEDIKALECLYLSSKFIFKDVHEFDHILNKNKLRVSISTVSNHSFVKGQKKLTVLNDYDKLAGIKSIFHSFRILNYGIQIGENGWIYDYTSMNWLWKELYGLSEKHEYNDRWDIIKTRYKEAFNQTSSKFKLLCPKEIITHDRRKEFVDFISIENIRLDNKQINKIIKFFDKKQN